MIYDIRLNISHEYDLPSAGGRHVVRVMPKLINGRQRVHARLISVDPAPFETSERIDFFGNRVTTVSHNDAHRDMAIRLSARVECTEPLPVVDTSPDLAGLTKDVKSVADLGPDSPLHFLGASPRLAQSSEIADFANSAVMPGLSAMDCVLALGQQIHRQIEFDPDATTVDTDPVEALQTRKGVCQDMTHIMIVGLRALGIPAGYVSGFLRTEPPAGMPRLEGADAMHAWVRAWCGHTLGWIEYDPTNTTLPNASHIVVGYGRDYSDVGPVKGYLRAAGGQRNRQEVDVIPVTLQN